jgi:hypothetical protein
MPILTFDKTPNQPRIITKIGIQILNRIKPMEKTNIELIKKVINQLVVEEKVNIKS